MLSENITVFPATNRDQAYSQTAQVLTERNISGIIRNLVDQDYVISPAYNENNFEFVINGYYFKTTSTIITDTLKTVDEIWANIKIAATTAEPPFLELTPIVTSGDNQTNTLDSDTEFLGISFTKTPGEGYVDKTGIYSLRVLVKDSSNNWVIPKESRYKMITDTTHCSVKIDDGILPV